MSTVEVRCPVGIRRLFTKLQLEGESPKITDGNLLEFACADCRKRMVRLGEEVSLVLHRYNFIGELVETEVRP